MADDDKFYPIKKQLKGAIKGQTNQNPTNGKVVIRVAEIVGELVENWLTAKARREEWEARQKVLMVELDRIDKDAAAFCKKMEGKMEPEKERTKRLEMFLDALTKNGTELSENLASLLIEKFSSCDIPN